MTGGWLETRVMFIGDVFFTKIGPEIIMLVETPEIRAADPCMQSLSLLSLVLFMIFFVLFLMQIYTFTAIIHSYTCR